MSNRPGERVPLTVRSLEPGDWPLVEELFGPRGACGGCWCMWWRVRRGGREWEERKGEPNRLALRALVEAGAVHAVLAFAGERAVAWCSFGPKADFPRLEASRVLTTAPAAGVWSLACFYVPAGWRGKGVATALLAGAVAAARAAGARVLEAYPVEPRAGRVPAAFAWTGVPALFAGAGFTPLPRAEGARPIYRLALR